MKEITEHLYELQDSAYRDFQAKLIPNVDRERIIGVRMPALRAYAKQLAKEPYVYDFLKELPHAYYEENNLHAALLGILFRDLDTYLSWLEPFVPMIDNWATCDMLSPKVFRKDLNKVYGKVQEWIASGQTYTVRLAVVTLLQFYLDDAFSVEHLDLAAGVQSEEYYVKMAVAWYFSIALVKQYDATIGYFTNPVLEPWTHNKALQKARESLRIDEERKAYLNTLKVKKQK
jgi:3-methyladenine DNA glycosylase AlkD